VKAQKARTLFSQDFKRAFEKCDLIASPAASSPAFAFNSKSDPYSMYMMDYYTIPMSLAGLPALSVPCGWIDDMPMGLQLAAPLFEEARLLGAAHAYEQGTQHAAKGRTMIEGVLA
jgi:aspartyl-tRNA(Asn)/glutamyl-tRNA(Gln) amidotransferase subunit A